MGSAEAQWGVAVVASCSSPGITADACSGDSGGPLFYPPMNGNPAILIGLVSYGPDCDETLASGSTPVGFNTALRQYPDAIFVG